MAIPKSPQSSSPSPTKQKSLPILGVQFFSSKKSNPKKYLVIEDDKKIWRDERLLTEASKKAFLEKLLKSKAAWLKQMAEESSTPVESRLSRAAGKILGLSPRKEKPKTGGKRKLTYSSKPAITIKTPPLTFKPGSPLSLQSSPKRLSPVKTPAAGKRPREPETVFSSIKKLFSFSNGKSPAGQLPLEIVDADGPANTRNHDLDWQTQGL